MAESYQDARIRCDEDGITIRLYYFPFGNKRIPFSRIEKFETFQMGAFSGRYRYWGTSNPRYWLNWDPDRPDKSTAIVLHVGGWVRPVLTPDDPAAFIQALQERIGTGGDR